MPDKQPLAKLSVYARIYRCIALVPVGKVVTYGQVSELIAASGARQVGYALSSTPDSLDIPWHRVINAKGEISQRSGDSDCSDGDSLQKQRLNDEGIVANKNGRINLAHFRWKPSAGDLLEIQMLDEKADADGAAWLDQPGCG